MEEILLNIDSRNRDTTKYPIETKFILDLDSTYKNIYSIKVLSLELTNSINLISSSKKNNFLTFHFPNKANDPDGIKISIDDEYTYNITEIKTNLNNKLAVMFNNETYKEKYFYIFYLNSDTNIVINTTSGFIIKEGWYSLYGIYNLIKDYILKNVITDFTISFALDVFDRRFETQIRTDTFNEEEYNSGDIDLNLDNFKSDFYSLYITDIVDFIVKTVDDDPAGVFGILDNLNSNLVYPYLSGSKYYINNINVSDDIYKLYNIKFNVNTTSTSITFTNSINDGKVYFFGVPATNDYTIASLLDKVILKTNNLITLAEFNNRSYTASLNKDVPYFEVSYSDFSYFLGFRPNTTNILSPTYLTLLTLRPITFYNLDEISYILIKINDWGYLEVANKKILSRCISNLTINNLRFASSLEYLFKQPINFNKLDIELLDHSGATLDTNHCNFSMTLELKQIMSSDKKYNIESKNTLFRH